MLILSGLIWIFGSVIILILACINKSFYEFIKEHPFGGECESVWVLLWPGALMFTIVEFLVVGPATFLEEQWKKKLSKIKIEES
jgi:hypothetical protein